MSSKRGVKRTLPDEMNMTLREFKKKKRNEFKPLKKSMQDFSKNIIHLPEEMMLKFNSIEEMFNDLEDGLKKWWEKA